MSNHDFSGETADGHMGLMTSHRWRVDPKTVLFMLARYKWTASILSGKNEVLEIGCGDAFGSRLVAETVGHLDCYDQDKLMIESAAPHPKIIYHAERFSLGKLYDAAYCLDVVEHMTKEEMNELLILMKASAHIVIIGSPSLESQVYASPLSRANHINCMRGPELKAAMQKYFREVLSFSMNDEIVSTGFSPLSHYNFAIGI